MIHKFRFFIFSLVSIYLMLFITLIHAQNYPCERYSDSFNRTIFFCNEKHDLNEFPQELSQDVQMFIFTGRKSNPTDIKMGGMFKRLLNLLELKISYTKMSFIPENSFERSTKLVKLDLSNNRINNFYQDAWKNLINVRILDLSKNQITSQILSSNVFAHMSKLEILDLSNNHIVNLEYQVFGNLTNLKELRLNENPLKTINKNAIYGSLMNLHFLNLSQCSLEELDVKFLNKIPKLKTLDIRNNSLKDVKNYFENLTSLTYIDLSSNGLQALNDHAFISLKLDYLDLSHNKLVNVSRDAFKDLECKDLKLSNNVDLNIRQLNAALQNLAKIENLDLSYLKIDDRDLEDGLFDSQNYYLKKVNLSNNYLTRIPKMSKFRLIDLELDFSFNLIKKLDQIEIKIPEIFEKLKTEKTYLFLHHNPLSCLKCDLHLITAIDSFNYKCEKDQYYCLKCITDDLIEYNIRNLSNLNETDSSSCDLPARLLRLHGQDYRSGLDYILPIIIVIVILCIFLFLAFLYRRRIFNAIYYTNEQDKSTFISTMTRKNYTNE